MMSMPKPFDSDVESRRRCTPPARRGVSGKCYSVRRELSGADVSAPLYLDEFASSLAMPSLTALNGSQSMAKSLRRQHSSSWCSARLVHCTATPPDLPAPLLHLKRGLLRHVGRNRMITPGAGLSTRSRRITVRLAFETGHARIRRVSRLRLGANDQRTMLR
jgi:hypothetical protein